MTAPSVRHTYQALARKEILGLVETISLSCCESYDQVGTKSNPLESERVRLLEGVLGRYQADSLELAEFSHIQAQAKILRQLLREVGAQREPRGFIVGRRSGR